MAGWAWVAVAVGLVIVAAAIVYGMLNSRRQSARDLHDQVEGTKRLYREGDSSD